MDFKDDTKLITALVGAITTLLTVIFGFIIKSRKQSIKYVESSWEELLEDSASFRNEIRDDLLVVKQERDELKKNLVNLESKLEEIIQENLHLKMREMELNYKLKILEDKDVRHDS